MSPRALVVAMIAARVLMAQTPGTDYSAVLERAREKLVGVARKLPKYTCIETVNRTYYGIAVHERSRVPLTENAAPSCRGLEFGHNGKLTLSARDRLRLQVAVASGAEIDSWPTASQFDNRTVGQLIPIGPISTGTFGTSLVDIFENPGARFSYQGRIVNGPREILEYSFRVPFEASHFRVRTKDDWKVTAYSGTFEINAATAEMARLSDLTDELPADADMCRSKTSTDYHYVLIGDGQFLLPERSVMETLSANGDETSSVTTFSECHEYAAESSLHFDTDDGTASSAQQKAPTKAPLPAGLSLTLTLTAPIDTGIAAAGDAVAAKVAKAVRARDSNQILVPAGAMVRGRILQMRHQYSPAQFLVSIHFNTLEANGVVYPLAVVLDRELKAETPRNQKGLRAGATEFTLPPPQLSGETGSWFAFSARIGAVVIPTGFVSKWITVPVVNPAPGSN
jgi:hypothetical protein